MLLLCILSSTSWGEGKKARSEIPQEFTEMAAVSLSKMILMEQWNSPRAFFFLFLFKTTQNHWEVMKYHLLYASTNNSFMLGKENTICHLFSSSYQIKNWLKHFGAEFQEELYHGLWVTNVTKQTSLLLERVSEQLKRISQQANLTLSKSAIKGLPRSNTHKLMFMLAWFHLRYKC